MSIQETSAEPPRRTAFRPPAPRPGDKPLSRLGLALTLRRNPITIWRRIHFEAPVVAGEGPLGYGAVLNDPAAIRHVLIDNVANYRKDRLQRTVLAPGLGDGLLTAEGEDWRRARRILAPLFTPRRVAALAGAMTAPIEASVARLERRSGRVVDVSAEMTRLTYDVLAATMFSNAIAGGAEAFSKALTRYFETQGVIDPLDLVDAPKFLPRIGRILARPAIAFFEDRVKAIVADRKALVASGAPAPDDLLQALLDARDPEGGPALSDREIGANIVTFIGAGHETTANLLSWSLYLLSKDDRVRAAVEAEADAMGDPVSAALDPASRLPMTRAVLEEAMRLYPPVPSLSREAIRSDVAAGVRIPRGAIVVIAPYVLHRHVRLWSDPALFMPDRFLPGAREAIDRFAYLPFGAGPRVCIGMQFSMVEAMLALSMIVRRVRLAHAGEGPPRPLHRITLRPDGGMPMRVASRG
jgi:cytochrome P450